MNCTIAVSGTASYLPSALTKTVLVWALTVGGFWAAAETVRTRSAEKKSSVAFMIGSWAYMIERGQKRTLQLQVSGMRFQVSGVRYQVSGVRYQVSGARCQARLMQKLRGTRYYRIPRFISA